MTGLGDRSSWPDALRATWDVMVRTQIGALVLWGPEARLLYNDGYAQLIGDKHPAAKGERAADVFPEVWQQVSDLLEQVRGTGEAVSLVDALFPLRRRGFVEDCWFTFCYSPVVDAGGAVVGVLDLVVETTGKVLAERRMRLVTTLLEQLSRAETRREVHDISLTVLRDKDVADLVAVDLQVPAPLAGRSTAWPAAGSDVDAAEAGPVGVGGAGYADGSADGFGAAGISDDSRVPERPEDADLKQVLADLGQDGGLLDHVTTTHPDGLPDRARLRRVRIGGADNRSASAVTEQTEVARGWTLVWQPVEDPVLALERLSAMVSPDGSAQDVATRTHRDDADRAGGARIGFRVPETLYVDDAYLDFLQVIGSTVSQALTRAGLREVERLVSASDRSMSLALQHSLLGSPHVNDRFDIAARYVPAARREQVGGDWHDAFIDAQGDLVICVGDIVGHDRNAAAQMAQVRNLLRGLAYDTTDGPARLLERLDAMVRDLAPDIVGTLVLGRITEHDLAWQMTWSNAGHPPPALLIEREQVALLDEHDLLLGADPTTPRHQHTVDLPHGSSVLFYTDGLIERRGQTIDDGTRTLVDTLRRRAATHGPAIAESASASGLADGLIQDLVPGHTVEDDVALMVVRVGAPTRPERVDRSRGDQSPAP